MSLDAYWEDARPTVGTTWSNASALTPWPARYGHCSVTTADHSIFVMCGVSENPPDIDSTVTPQTYFNDIWRSGDGGLTWDCLHTSAPFGVRAFAAAAVITVSGQERIYVIGGEYEEEKTEGVYETFYLNDCFYSADGGETWSTGTIPSGWSARSRHALTAITSSMMLLSGGRDASTVYNSVHTFDGTSWSAGGALASPRFGHAQLIQTISDVPTIVIVGGRNSSSFITGANTILRSTDNGATWFDMETSSPKISLPSGLINGIEGCSAAMTSTLSYVSGGRNASPGSYFNDVYFVNSTVSNASVTDISLRSVVFGNGTFVAVDGANSNNRIITSSDGATWNVVNAPQNNTWTSVTYGSWTTVSGTSHLFVAVASSGTNRVMTSPDGTTWTLRAAAEANAWTSVTFGNSTFVAVSRDGTNRVMTSPDGTTWTARTAAEANAWTSVTFGNGTFVAVSSDGTNRVMTSSDGTTWTAQNAAANFWTSVTYGSWTNASGTNHLFVAVANLGISATRVMTSSDGTTWTLRTAAAANAWTSVTFGNGTFVAVSSGGANRVMTSSDGTTWTARTAAAANVWTSVTFGNGTFVAVANNGSERRIMNSTDATIWYSYSDLLQSVTPHARWSGRAYHAMVWDGTDRLVLMGGQIQAGRHGSDPIASNDIWSIVANTTTNAVWNQVSNLEFMSGRSLFGIVVVNTNDVIIVGGWETGDPSGVGLNDVWRSNDGGRNFYKVGNGDFSRRHSHGCAMLGSSIYISGGSSGGREVWRSDDLGLTWTQLGTSPLTLSHSGHAMVRHTDRLLILGGGSSLTNRMFTSTNGSTWNEVAVTGSTRMGSGNLNWTGNMWSPREYFACAVSSTNDIYVMGGTVSYDGTSDQVWKGTFSNPSEIEWTQLISMPAVRRHLSAAIRTVSSTDYLYVFGGGTSGSEHFNTIWYLSNFTGSWTVAAAPEWIGRRGHRSVAVEDRVLVIGGRTGHDGTTRTNDVWYSSSATLESGSWFVEAPNGKAGRHGSALVRSGTDVYLVAGWNGAFYMNDVWKSSNEGGTWSLMIEHAAFPARQEHIVERANTSVLALFGGVSDTGRLDDLWISSGDSIGEVWNEKVLSTRPSARSEHAALRRPIGETSILICGGVDNSSAYLNDTWILTWTDGGAWDSCSWRQIVSAPWPARSQHALCRAGDNCLMLGGKNASTIFNDIWMFNFGTEQWTLLLSSAPWSPRYSHAACALDDSTLFIIGGTDGENTLDEQWVCSDGAGNDWILNNVAAESDVPPARRDHCVVSVSSGVLIVDGISEGRILNDSWITTFGWSQTSALFFRRRPRTDDSRLDLGEREGGRVASDHILVRTSPIADTSITINSGQVMWLARLRSKWDENLKSTIVARLRVNKSHFDGDFTLVARFTNNTSYLIGPSSSVQTTSMSTIQRGASVAEQLVTTSAEDEDAYVLVQEGSFTVSVSGVIITTTAVAMTGPDSAMSGTKYVEIGIRNASPVDLIVTTPPGETILEIQSISPPRWAGVAPIPRESTSSTYTAVAKLESPTNELDAPMIYHSRNSTMKFKYRDVVVASGVSPSYSTYADWISALDARSTFKHIIYSEITIYSPVSTFSVNPTSPRYFEFNRIGADGTTRTISEHYYANGYGGRTFPIPSGESVSGSYVFTQRSVMENVAGQQARLLITSGFQGDSSDGTNILNSIISFNPNLSGFAGGDPHVWSLNGVYTLPTRPMVISFLDTLDALGKHARLGINCTAEPLSMSQIAASCASAARPDKMAQELRTMTFWGTIFVFRKEGKRTAMVAIHAETLHILFAKGDVYVYGTDAADVSDALIRIGQAKRVPDMPDSRCPTARIASSTALARTIMFPRVIDRVAPLCFTLSADPISCPYDRSSIELAFDLSMRSGLVMNTTEIRTCHGAIIGPDSYDTLSSLFDIRPIEQIRASRRRVPDRWTVCDETGKHIRVDTPSRPVFTQ